MMCKLVMLLLTCNTLIVAGIYGEPDPPTNLSVQVQGGNQASITWNPPLNEPNTPAKFIVWFRDETTLLLVWQPPNPASTYSHYRLSIEPPDAHESVIYVEKEEGLPGQGAFKGLMPGRAYNISLQTISEDEISTPTTSQYRTLPLRPLNVTVVKSSVTSNSFKVTWKPPSEQSEFDKYRVAIRSLHRLKPVLRSREDFPLSWEFREQLEAGKTYQVTVTTISGNVSAWPCTADVTLKPSPVQHLKSHVDEESRSVVVSWMPSNISTQDSYKVTYHEVDSTGDNSTVMTDNTDIALDNLLPGRNYSIVVQSVSNGVYSDESVIYMTTLPSDVILDDLRSLAVADDVKV